MKFAFGQAQRARHVPVLFDGAQLEDLRISVLVVLVVRHDWLSPALKS